MTERQNKILEELIKEYIKKAEPVSSGFLVEKCGLDCSAATVRNELMELETAGYLTQPHTSAGRIPTDQGYRYFVDHLLKEKESDLSSKDQKVLDKTIAVASRNPHALSSGIARTMAGLTKDFVVSGIAETDEFYRFGFSNIFDLPEFEIEEEIPIWGNIFDEFEHYFQDLFAELPLNKLLVYIGRENPMEQGRGETVIMARYPLPEGYEGISAVIGPMRMAYDRNLALLKYLTKKMKALNG